MMVIGINKNQITIAKPSKKQTKKKKKKKR